MAQAAVPGVEIEPRFRLHSHDAEQAVLGAVLNDNAAWDRVADLLSPGDFYFGKHRTVFEVIGRMLDSQRAADLVTVSDYLAAQNLHEPITLKDVGGIAAGACVPANARRYAEIVRDRSILRRLSSVVGEIQLKLSFPEGGSASEVLDWAQEQIVKVTQSAEATAGFRELRPILTRAVEHIDAAYNREGPDTLSGLSSGFADLDRLTDGFRPGDLITVGARPSMGKTSFALNIAEHVALRENLAVGVFSLEMPEEQLATRLLSGVARLNHFKMRKGALRDEDWPKLTGGVGRLVDAPIWIDESSSLSPTELRARARRLKRETGRLGLLVVDYLQLMTGGSGETRQQQIGDYSRTLKQLAKELGCPVIALSQVNRGVETRTDKRPNLSDLRESGDIEQDSDVVMFLYRDEVYRNDSPDRGIAEVIVAKQRNGPLGTVRLAFVGELMRFEDLARL